MASIQLCCKYFDDNKLYLVALMYLLQVWYLQDILKHTFSNDQKESKAFEIQSKKPLSIEELKIEESILY